MRVYQTNNEGFYVGPAVADPDPMIPGNWLIPKGCVKTQPPELLEGQRAKWNGSSWDVIDPEPQPEPEPEPEPTTEELRAQAEENRQADYSNEADPLFFQWQRGEATEQKWLDKVAEIKARYPYPEETTQ